jgi:regulation of enolase protein 1 (concanavalin A-like superfamily)
MKHTILLSFIAFLFFFSCQSKQKSETTFLREVKIDQSKNLLSSMTMDDLQGFQWINPPVSHSFEGGILKVFPGDTTDFFNDPASEKIVDTAPLLYKEMRRDFVATAKVKPDFRDIWNACAMMVYVDSTNWGKLCFENSDATGPSVVSVVTKDRSDDCNGPVVNKQAEIWMKVARKDNVFGFYWSLDGDEYKMARLFSLPEEEYVKIGIVAQCPASSSVEHQFLYFSLEEKTINDMRKGI